MVGGLVQQKQIRFAHQKAGQRGSCFLTAAETGNLSGKIALLKPKALDNPFGPAFTAESAQVLILMGQIAVLFQQMFQRIALHLAHFLFQMAQLIAHGENIIEHLHHGIQQRKARGKLRHLLHIAHGVTGAHGELAFVKALLPGDTAEQRGFARSVGADQPHLFAFLHVKIEIFKN